MLGFAPLATATLASSATATALPELTATVMAAFAVAGAADARSPTVVQATPDILLSGKAKSSVLALGGAAAALAIPVTGLGTAITTGIGTGQFTLAGELTARCATAGAATGELALACGAVSGVGIAASAQGRQLPLSLAAKASLRLAARLQGAMPVGLALWGESHSIARTASSLDLMAQGQATARLVSHVAGESGLAGSGHARAMATGRGQFAFELRGAAVAHSLSEGRVEAEVLAPGLARVATALCAQAAGAVSVQRLGDGLAAVMAQTRPALPLHGASAGHAAARIMANHSLSFFSVAQAKAAITGSSLAGIDPGVEGSASTAITAAMLPKFTLEGAGFAVSVPPRFAHLQGALPLAGAATSHATAQANSLKLTVVTGFAQGLTKVLGSGASRLDLAAASTVAMHIPATVGSTVLLAGQADASVQSQGAASGFQPMSGSGLGALSVHVQAASDQKLQGHRAGYVPVAGGASGSFMVARDLAADIAIVSDAARAIPLQGQAAAQMTTQATAAPDAIAIEGQATAASAGSGCLQIRLATHGAGTSRTTVASDATLVFAVALSVSASAPRQAMSEGRAELSGGTRALIPVSGVMLGSMRLAGSASGDLLLTVTAQGRLAVARSALAIADVDAMSGRILPFAVAARAGTALSVAVSAPLSVSGQGRAALAAHAAVNRAIDLAGAVTTDAGLAAAGQTGFDLNGAAYAQASIGADGRGAIARAATAVAETEIAGGSARSLHVAGSATGHIPLTAEAIGDRVNLKPSATLRVDARAGATGDVAFDAALRGQAVSSGAATGYVALTRTGAGDVAISSHSARVILFPGHASLAIASAGAANPPFAMTPLLLGYTTIGAGLEQNASVANGQGAAIIESSGSARPGAWPMAGRSAAFRAPPALQRAEPPRTGLSGRLLSSNSGRILRG